MADIITAENLPLVIGAIGTVIGGIVAARQGNRLGDRARSEKPPSPESVIAGGLVMSNVGSADMIMALRDIAGAVREATDEARAHRTAKTQSVLQRIEEKLGVLDDDEKHGRLAR